MKTVPLVLTFLSLTACATSGMGPAGDGNGIRDDRYHLPLADVGFKGGKWLHFSHGVGSGAFHARKDPATVVYTVSDRGVNIECESENEVVGIEVCPEGKLFPVPAFAPTIYKFELDAKDGWLLRETVSLKNHHGRPVTGLPPEIAATRTERAYGADGAAWSPDPEGLDPEALVRLDDGTFWLAEEYGPSLLHVAADGEILERLVPASEGDQFGGADFPVTGSLPDILTKRVTNRGIEALAVSPDEKYLFFALQSPLANPDIDAFVNSRNVRLFKLDLSKKQVVAEYLYVIDPPETFREDKETAQSKVKLNEMTALSGNELLIVEEISNTTKIYRVDLDAGTDLAGSVWDEAATSPSLEQVAPEAQGINPVTKRAVIDSAADYPGLLPAKIEGMALLDDRHLLLINDNDFGIFGEETRFVVVPFHASSASAHALAKGVSE